MTTWTRSQHHSNEHMHRALTVIKAKLKGAVTGHSLLKKKSDALTMRFRAILSKIVEV